MEKFETVWLPNENNWEKNSKIQRIFLRTKEMLQQSGLRGGDLGQERNTK